MQSKLTGVIKRSQVRQAGACVLPGEQGAHAEGVAAADGCAAAQARILEQKDGLAVVEIICSCGRKMLLNCETKPQ